jgi:hypothetical protein
VSQQTHAAEEESTNSLDERRTMYFDAEADDTRVDAVLGELRLLPMLETKDTTDDLEQRLEDIVHQKRTSDSDS